MIARQLTKMIREAVLLIVQGFVARFLRSSQWGRVGSGRPSWGRPTPSLANRACDLSPHTALTFAWILVYSVSGQHQHTPLFLSLFSQTPLACFLPNRAGFATVTCGLSDLSVPLERSARAITAVRRVLSSLLHHAGMTLFR
jgi:hypothetical protein